MRKNNRVKKPSKVREVFISFHQQNPPPGNLAACGKTDLKRLTDVLTTDRDQVDCPDCLSSPDPTIVIR